MFLLLLVGAFILLGFTQPAHADAMTIGVQDQGADPAFLTQIAGQLGTRTVRVIASPQNPHTSLIRDYANRGLTVQAAILVKRTTTAGDIRGVIRSWRGLVRTVSIGNEPELNGVPACTYARLFRRSRMLIRREFPGTVIGFGEFSPVKAFEYIQQIARCRPHVRIRAAFTAVHPYQFFSDPLDRPTERSGVGTWVGLGNLGSFKAALRRLLLPRRLRATEFSYLVDGRYKISMDKAAAYWPRAIKQAAKYADELVIYGLGVVHISPSQSWGSASLVDRFGRATPALSALARALGRVIPTWQDPPPVPSGDLVTDLPSDIRRPLPPVATDSVSDDPSVGNGSSVLDEKPMVITDPSMEDGPVSSAPPEQQEQDTPAPPVEAPEESPVSTEESST